jgi:hypothetical protein
MAYGKTLRPPGLVPQDAPFAKFSRVAEQVKLVAWLGKASGA